VIAVTAHAGGQKEKLLSAGMNDYLAKPIEEEKLHTAAALSARLHSVVPASLPPAEPIVDHNQTLDWQLALRRRHEAGSGAGDAANADRLYAGGA
jgi:two-component system sensor histidine kinase BarA